jgi:hypothetical protein
VEQNRFFESFPFQTVYAKLTDPNNTSGFTSAVTEVIIMGSNCATNNIDYECIETNITNITNITNLLVKNEKIIFSLLVHFDELHSLG